MFLEIPYRDQAKFPNGDGPRWILNWLEQRGRLGQLDVAFQHLEWSDLTAILCPPDNRAPPHSVYRPLVGSCAPVIDLR